MNKTELIQIIREVVRSELKISGPSLIREALIGSLQSADTALVEETPFEQPISRLSIQEVEKPEPPKKKKPFVNYVKDPVLNEVLNNTAGGVPQGEGSIVQTETSAIDKIKSLPKEVLSENTAMSAVAAALTKDYRSILKAADAKAKQRR